MGRRWLGRYPGGRTWAQLVRRAAWLAATSVRRVSRSGWTGSESELVGYRSVPAGRDRDKPYELRDQYLVRGWRCNSGYLFDKLPEHFDDRLLNCDGAGQEVHKGIRSLLELTEDVGVVAKAEGGGWCGSGP